MASKRMLPKEIETLRSTLKLSEGEFATRIGLDDRRMLKLLESGAQRPSDSINKLLMKLLRQSAGRSPKLKRMLETIKTRVVEYDF